MQKKTVSFSGSAVDFYFNDSIDRLNRLVGPASTFLLTDEHVYAAHTRRFRNFPCIVLKPGEAYKNQATVDAVIGQLIEMGADRGSTLVGIGGGVVTDITGYVASVYMRGINFGFVPTSLLALVDASIGGKNGVDVGVYKNMVGLIRQPQFILHDLSLLRSLPAAEWANGFAEIIKHACIRDAALFRQLEENTAAGYRKNPEALERLIRRNALLKSKVVQADPFERGERKLLNFGHTLGHAIENIYELSHGQAISIGMAFACHLSQEVTGFRDTQRVTRLLQRYKLPAYADFDRKKAYATLQKDKKKNLGEIGYVLLDRIGKGMIHRMPLAALEQRLAAY
ncbi:MAG TPA: 3-dehydroquinate synthase [Lacibacter sp.]|nr:3-dehydroquinate synthase [Lacibacter sp.]HMO89058.1 3-dehydroquinate synthase [Lacibacter sp.]HMP87427.1 3-dehydroquinate synthase [Lacibacter sp.]